MRVIKTTPCYCTECDAGNALTVRFQNPEIVQNGSIALCIRHAEQLASMLLQRVRESRL